MLARKHSIFVALLVTLAAQDSGCSTEPASAPPTQQHTQNQAAARRAKLEAEAASKLAAGIRETAGDTRLRGHVVFGRKQGSDRLEVRVNLYGADESTLMSKTRKLVGVQVFGVPTYGSTTLSPSLLGEFDANPGFGHWESNPRYLSEKDALLLAAESPKGTPLSRYRIAAFLLYQVVGSGKITSDPIPVLSTIEAPGIAWKGVLTVEENKEAISMLAAGGTFHPQQGQAIFDIDPLVFNFQAHKIEVYAGPTTSDVFASDNRIYRESPPSTTSSGGNFTWIRMGITGPYDGSNSWKLGVLVYPEGGGAPTPGVGTFDQIQPGSVNPLP